MKKTQVLDLFANIKNTIVSFISILMFVALGVGVFLGISWASPALENGAINMLDTGTFHNFQLQFPYGLTDNDIKQVSKLDGITDIEPERQSFQTLKKDGNEYTIKVQSLGQKIDMCEVVEGELPKRENEIAVLAAAAEDIDIHVGDTMKFEKDATEDDTASGASGTDGTQSTNDSGMQYLKRDSFKVTAIVKNPDYVSDADYTFGFSATPSGKVHAVAWIMDSVFDASAFQNGYPIVNIRCDSLNSAKTFDDEYKQASNEIQGPLDELGSKLATARYDDLHGQAQSKIDDAQAQLDAAEDEIEKGELEIANGEQELVNGRAELNQKRSEGQAKLDSAYQELMDGEAAKADAERRLSEANASVNDAQSRLNQADNLIAQANAEVTDAENYKTQCDQDLAAGRITQEEYNKRLDERGARADGALAAISQESGAAIPSIDHTNFSTSLALARTTLNNSESIPVVVDGETMTLGEARTRLNNAKTDLANAQAEYDSAVAELNSGWNAYYEGQATLNSEVAKAEQDIADGERKLEDAKKQVAEGKQKVDESKPQLEDAKAKLGEMVKFQWSVMPRSFNAGLAEVSTFSNVTNSLSISMAALFIIVGLLVSYFAVSRIVHEQVTQIGTKKALGLRQGEITSGFLWYSGIAVVAGAIVGALLAYLLVEGIIDSVLGDMFAFGPYPAYFGWGLFLIMTAIELVLVLGATYLACRKILKQHAVELLRGDKPPTGKTRFYEKWGIWEKLPLLIQTIVNNCVNDARRALSTIVGVAGCTALIVTAITLNNDVMKSYDRHYENVYGFNAIAYANFEPENAAENVEKALIKQGCQTAIAYDGAYLIEQPDGDCGAINAIVPIEEDAFWQLYHVNPTEDATVDLSAEGVWVSQAYGEHFGAKPGDTIVIDGGDGMKHEMPILGFYEFWLSYNEMVVGRKYFEKEFGKITPNVVLTQTGEKSVEDIEQLVSATQGFNSIVDDAKEEYSSFETFSTVSVAVVIIYLALAVLMAVVVLLNLNVMFISEKKRELIVLMICGFSVKDARHYISYDSIVLTALGIIVGILLGCIMGSITVMSIEPVTGVFVKSVDLWAVIIGILGSTLLAIIMGAISLRRINKFDLTDINRF